MASINFCNYPKNVYDLFRLARCQIEINTQQNTEDNLKLFSFCRRAIADKMSDTQVSLVGANSSIEQESTEETTLSEVRMIYPRTLVLAQTLTANYKVQILKFMRLD